MVHAVRVPTHNMICFVMGEPVTKPGWTVEPGGWLEVPINTFYGFRDSPELEWAICQAVNDPRHYKIYMDREQAEPEEWRETGLNFGGTFSAEAWEEYAPILPEGEPAPSTVSDEEVEAYDNMLRNLRGGR